MPPYELPGGSPNKLFTFQSDQRQAAAVELLGQLAVMSQRIGRFQWPAAGSVRFVGVEDAVLAEILATVVGRVIIQQAVQCGLRALEPGHQTQKCAKGPQKGILYEPQRATR